MLDLEVMGRKSKSVVLGLGQKLVVLEVLAYKNSNVGSKIEVKVFLLKKEVAYKCLDRSARIDGGRQNMPRAGPGLCRRRAHTEQNRGLGIPAPGVGLLEAESELFRPG